MSNESQTRIPATYMRGGTSKGVFFSLTDLPAVAQTPGAARDALLLRVIGSPDPYHRHTDGMGGATSSTSKVVILSKSTRGDHDVDYLFGQVAIDRPFIDWSGNCGNLTAAVGSFAIIKGLLDASRIPDNGQAEVRIWQANINKTIIARIPMVDGEVQETGDFELDGVTFPAAEIQVEFLQPVTGGEMFPTGNVVDALDVPGIGVLEATMINAGIPTIFINAASVGYNGTETQDDINNNDKALAMFETIRAHGAVQMGLIKVISEAEQLQHSPKLAIVAEPASYTAANGREIDASDIDLLVRALSMGKLHHAMMGTAAVAIGIAAVIPGTLVNLAAGSGRRHGICFGHPSGTLKVSAEVTRKGDEWIATRTSLSRSARVLMEGWVRVPVEFSL